MFFVPTEIISPRKYPVYIMIVTVSAIILLIPPVGQARLYFAAGGLLVFGLFLYSLYKTRIILDNEGISFHFPFRKNQTLAWKDILESRMGWHYHGHGGTLLWEFRRAGKTSSFQPSFYSRKHLRSIAEALLEKCPGAAIDDRIRKIAAGKFPWYLF